MCNPKYSVVGYYSDNNQPWLKIVQAENSAQATFKAVLAVLDINGWDEDDADKVKVVMVLAGECHDVKLPCEVVSGADVVNTLDVMAKIRATVERRKLIQSI